VRAVRVFKSSNSGVLAAMGLLLALWLTLISRIMGEEGCVRLMSGVEAYK
jgi:hypothetical protein